MKQIKMKLL